MNSKIISISFLLFSIFLLIGCTQQQTNTENNYVNNGLQNMPAQNSLPQNEAKFLKGVSLSPKSFNAQDFSDFFVKAKQAGSIITWSGDWKELEKTNSPAMVAAQLSKTYDFTPIIIVQFFSQSSGKLLRPLNNETKIAYKKSIADFAQKFKPKYLGIGIEVNILFEKNPQEFENFAKFYSEVYDSVKANSPDTKVFTIFQLEKMKGLGGGLFGGTNDETKNEWALLEKFPKNDLIVFTSYPGLIYKNPSEIPENYYSEISFHSSKKIVFTELGWHSISSPIGWESSEEKQSEFVERFFSLSKNLNKEFVVWSFLFDQETIEPFNSMGLISREGKEKTAWNKWKAQKN